MREEISYSDWKKELLIWSDFTDLKVEQQGGALFLTLKGKARQIVLDGVTRAEMKTATGIKSVTDCLDKLFEKDENQSAYTAFDDFTNYRRNSTTSIDDYLVEFNLKHSKIKSHNMTLPEGVLAYYLLKCANLTEEQMNICRATCLVFTYDSMKTQIGKVTTTVGTSDSKNFDTTTNVQPQFYAAEYEHYDYYADDHDEPDNTYYTRPGYYRSRPSPSTSQGAKLNPPDEFGNPSKCSFCHSIYHWVNDCLDASRATFSRGRGNRRPTRGGRGFRGGRPGAF